MKSTIIIAIAMLLLITCHSAFADLTQRDLEKIQQMLDKQKAELREYIDLKVDPVKQDLDKLKQDLDKQKVELKEYIDLRIAQVDTKVEEVKSSITLLTWALGFVALFIIAVLAAPQWITIRREGEDRKLAEKIDMIEKEIAELKNR